jgi:ABC-type phosphate/phosphonate transport system substrate-binding protein
MCRYDAWTKGLRVLSWTEPTPGLPFITAFTPLAPVISQCLAAAIKALPADLKADLTIRGLVQVPPEAYTSVPDPRPEATPVP